MDSSFGSAGADMGFSLLANTYNAGLSDILSSRANERSMQNLRESNEMSRANFRDSARLQKEGAIRAGMSPLGSYQSTNITPSAPTATAGGSFPTTESNLLGHLQLKNETKIADAQQKLLDEQRRGMQIDNDRKVGYDTALQDLINRYPELNFNGLNISNKGVFDAITGYENLRRDVMNNKRLNEEDKLYYDALTNINNNPELKKQFETFVFENYRNIKVVNEKLLSNIVL